MPHKNQEEAGGENRMKRDGSKSAPIASAQQTIED